MKRWKGATEVIDIQGIAGACVALSYHYATRWHRWLHGGTGRAGQPQGRATIHYLPHQEVADLQTSTTRQLLTSIAPYWDNPRLAGLGLFQVIGDRDLVASHKFDIIHGDKVSIQHFAYGVL